MAASFVRLSVISGQGIVLRGMRRRPGDGDVIFPFDVVKEDTLVRAREHITNVIVSYRGYHISSFSSNIYFNFNWISFKLLCILPAGDSQCFEVCR